MCGFRCNFASAASSVNPRSLILLLRPLRKNPMVPLAGRPGFLASLDMDMSSLFSAICMTLTDSITMMAGCGLRTMCSSVGRLSLFWDASSLSRSEKWSAIAIT